ncbi:tail assembly chaperone [Gordonia phage ChadMasterC]|nr:tail assembly chaperone [Gordonia phage ChadMasterC]
MATKTKAPAANASVHTWRKFIGEAYPDVPEGEIAQMNRQDMRELHGMRSTSQSSKSVDEHSEFEAPSLDEVPEELRFSTDTGEDREVERMPFAMDGIPFWLYRPSDAAMTLYMNQLLSDDPRLRTNAMTTLVQQSVDPAALMYLQERITDRANNFDDGLYGNVVAAVLQRWGDETAATRFKQAQEGEAKNRQQRRAAARSKRK